MRLRAWALYGPSLAVLALATSAIAQDGANVVTVEDIVVTANKREERLQDVPIAVSAITASGAERIGVNATSSLSVAVPGLVLTQQGNGATTFIRGIGNPSGVIGQEATVSTYIDGVYIASPQANIFSFNNIERIEVLKGPQGTLFGRNATGGVIHVITRQPGFDPKLDISAGYANYDTVSGSLYASTGLSDTVAINIAAVGSKQRDGWGKNLTTGGELFRSRNYGIRAKLLWEPSDNTSVTLAADHSYAWTEVGGNYHVVPGTVGVGGVVYAGYYNSFVGDNSFLKGRQTGVSGTISHDFGAVRLVSISSYRDVKGAYEVDQDAGPAVIVDALLKSREKNFSQEFQLLSAPDAPVQWVAGAYYLWANTAFTPLRLRGAAFGGATLEIFAPQKTNSYSAFGQASTNLTDATRVTLGLRYTSDHREVSSDTLANGFSLGGPSQRATFSKVTWRIALDHRFTEDVMAYASYNRGFKSGIFNTIAAGDPAVRPEVLDAYEIGLKSELFDRRLRFNAAAFYYDYQDIQVDSVVTGGTRLLNAAAAKIKGVDLDMTAALGAGLTLTAGASYLDGKYKDFPDAPFYSQNPASVGGVSLAASPADCPPGRPFTGAGCNAAGNQTVQTPRLTFNVGVAYERRLATGVYDVNANLYRNSGFKWSVDNRLSEPSYVLLNGSIGWQASNGRYDVRLWAENLLGEKRSVLTVHEVLGDHASPAAPRTFGVKFGAHF